jgi:hypothetical protein
MLRCSRMLAIPQKYGRACIWECLSLTLYLYVLFSNRYYPGLLYQLRNIFIKLLFTDSRYCKRVVMIKRVGSLRKPVSTILLRPQYLYWGGKLILSPVWMWLNPQQYRYWCFGCMFSGCRRRPNSTVFGVLRLRHIASVVVMRTRMSSFDKLL